MAEPVPQSLFDIPDVDVPPFLFIEDGCGCSLSYTELTQEED